MVLSNVEFFGQQANLIKTANYLNNHRLLGIMKGTIVNFRSSRHRQKDNQMIIKVEGVSSKTDAEKLTGSKVAYKTETGREISGKVASAHGNKGAIRVLFERGMPGQSLAKTVDIQ